MWTRPFQIAVRNQSEAELSDCRELTAEALRRESGAQALRCRHAAADNTFLILYNLYFLFYICILLSDVRKRRKCQ